MKKMPFNLEAEQCVLGAVLIDENTIRRVSQRLEKEDFYKVAHQHIFDVMVYLDNQGTDIDYTTILEVLTNKGFEREVGGIDYLVELSNILPTAENVDSYIDIVKNKALSRQIISMATNIAEASYKQDISTEELIELTEEKVFEVTKKRKSADFRRISSVVKDVIVGIEKNKNSDGELTGASSGFVDFDNSTLGLQKGDLIILAARPAMGKSAFAINIAYNVAKQGKHVAIFSLEMSAEQIVTRLLSSVSTINNMKIRSGNVSSKEWQKIEFAGHSLSKLNIYFDDESGSKITDVYAKCRQLAQDDKLDFIVIDYLQLLTGSGNYGGNRVVEVSEISRKLKNLARDLNIPVLALSQLSRGVETRQDKRPNMSDLRESGSIEQDADIVMFLYRDDYYDEDSAEKGKVEVDIKKNRSGSINKFEVLFAKEIGLFKNLSRVPREPQGKDRSDFDF
ncbi:replicative DNA helicase [Mycoplasmatota bacterium]|nr:replicative DNA helicase [Mycoplasmatota bacterium]